jgi:hypothetical protein
MTHRLDDAGRTRRLITLLSFSCFGCSFAFVSGPPTETAPSPRPDEQCTTSVLYPVLDSVGAAVGALNIGIAADASPGKVRWYGAEMDSGTGVALGITQLALFGAGAIYGFVQTSRCNAFLDERQQEQPESATWTPALANQEAPPPDAANRAPPVEPNAPPPAARGAAPPVLPDSASSARSPATGTARPATSPGVPTAAFPD